tara:strand:+ start:5262 stop:5999 length:738 start_codon:yes stop_codon:yes gene_type:complete
VFENIIKFKTSKIYLNNFNIRPKPSKLNIPDWYKEISHNLKEKTVKGCMPFLDTLTIGYTLSIPIEYRIKHNIKVDNERISKAFAQLDAGSEIYHFTNVNTYNDESHPIGQLGMKCPFVQKNKTMEVHKILNPWIIETPPGYSCLFLPPLNNTDDRFSIIPGIVDTDVFPNEINFPFIVNGDKYPVLDTVIKEGTPYVQVIPFKRESWKMKIETISKSKNLRHSLWGREVIHRYKNKFWNKKIWK